MADYIYTHVGKDCISITIDLTNYDIVSICLRINAVCGDEEMNVANSYLTFLKCYLKQHVPDIFEVLKIIPSATGAEMCSLYIEDVNEENKKLAEKLVQIIETLFSNEDKIFSFLEQNSGDIDCYYNGNITNYNIGAVSQFWISDYVVYGLYLGDPEKFLVSANTDSPTSVRKTGDNSGYIVILKYNNQGVDHSVLFQITSVDADLIHVQGGVSGKNYIDSDMDANSAIQLLLSY